MPAENALNMGFFSPADQRMSNSELDQLEALMDQPDPELYKWITRKVQAPAELDGPVLHALQLHALSNPMRYSVSAKQ